MADIITPAPEDVTAILKDVTPSPWENDGCDALFAGQGNLVCIVANNTSNNYGQDLSDKECAANARFIAWARNNIEALAADRDAHKARADAAEAKAARLVEALREIKTCTTEYGGAAKALRIINAALRGEGRG